MGAGAPPNWPPKGTALQRGARPTRPPPLRSVLFSATSYSTE
eukprot:gene6601-5931_t